MSAWVPVQVMLRVNGPAAAPSEVTPRLMTPEGVSSAVVTDGLPMATLFTGVVGDADRDVAGVDCEVDTGGGGTPASTART